MRYDSPALGPVTLSVSAGQRDKYEGAARWSQGLGGGQISAGLYYGSNAAALGGAGVTQYGGSIAYLFSFGTSLQFSYAEQDRDVVGADNGKTWYVKVGHNWGNNSVSLGYGEAEDAIPGVAPGHKDKGFNIGYNYNIPKAKVDLYASFHQNELDASGPAVDDLYAVVVGTKLRFD